jgi:uncharacterized caspase-like protein/uncharacterized protein YraI
MRKLPPTNFCHGIGVNLSQLLGGSIMWNRLLQTLVVLAFVALGSSALAETRVALVIGNSAYINATALPNPVNDARAVAAKLTSIGFEVALHENLDGQAFRIALGDFSEKALNADLALVFYAGHGIEMGGQNYLIPVDAKMKSEATAQFEAVPLEQVLSSVREAGKLGLVMLDACRDNPFATSMSRKNGTRAVSRGLASISVEGESGMLISFAAEAGKTAEDGDAEHSPYTAALLTVLDQPGLEVGRMFRAVRAKVKETTKGVQVPVEQAQLPDQDIYLVGEVPAAPAQAPNPTPGPAPAEDALLVYLNALESGQRAPMEDFIRRYPDHPRAADARAVVADMAEAEFWAAAQAKDTEDAYRAYLLGFPQGRYRAVAEAKIATYAAPPVPEPEPVPATAPLPESQTLDPAVMGSCPMPDGPWSVQDIASDDTLFVRSGPAKTYPELGELAYNATGISVGRCEGKWCQVQYGCISGYAFGDYLTKGHADNPTSEFSGLYRVVDHPVGEMLNIRSGPGTQYSVVSELVPNAIDIVVTDCQAIDGYDYRWCNLSWNNVAGWGYGRYLADGQGRKPIPVPVAAQSGDMCFSLWYERNAIFDANGYCFGTDKGKANFSNEGCFTSNPDLTASERRRVTEIEAEEARRGC